MEIHVTDKKTTTDQKLDKLIDHLQHHQPNQQVTVAANNPMTWISIVGALFVLFGTLVFNIYNSDKDAFQAQLTESQETTKQIQENLSKSQGAILQIQNNQQQFLKELDKMSQRQEATSKELTKINLTRFEEKDGRDIRDDLLREINSLKTEINGLLPLIIELKASKQLSEQNASKLDERSKFMEDMKNRVRELEIKEHNR